MDKTLPSGDTPGKWLSEHEDLHVRDLQDGYSENAVNESVQTEGYKTLRDCNAGARTIGKRWENYAKSLDKKSCGAHDKHSCETSVR